MRENSRCDAFNCAKVRTRNPELGVENAGRDFLSVANTLVKSFGSTFPMPGTLRRVGER